MSVTNGRLTSATEYGAMVHIRLCVPVKALQIRSKLIKDMILIWQPTEVSWQRQTCHITNNNLKIIIINIDNYILGNINKSIYIYIYIHGDIKSFVSQAGSQSLGAAVTRRRRFQYYVDIVNKKLLRS